MNTILVIEADPSDRADILALLHKRGLAARVAANTCEGLNLIRQHLPDLVICASQEPELDGYALLAELRQEPQFAPIPVVLLAKKLNKAGLHRAMRLGAVAYLIKPVSEADLLEVVEANLSRNSLSKQRQVQEELRQSEDRFYKFFQQAPIALAVTRPNDGLFLDVNVKFLEFLGYTAAEITNRNSIDLVWIEPGERERLLEILARQNSVSNWQFKFRTKSGELRLAVLSSQIIQYKEEYGFLTSFLDITERKEAEEALQRSQELLNHAQELGKIGSYSFELATQRLTWSDQMYRIHGLEPGELEPSLETGRPFVQPNDWKLLGELSLKAETEGQAECEVRVITKQGEPRNVLVKINLLRDHEGKPHSLLGIIQDITERKAIEENLRQSEKLFRSLAEKSPETIFILDMPSYRPIYQNRDEFLGYSRDELQARGSVILDMHPDEEAAVIEQWQKLLKGQIDQLEYRLQAKNGEWVWLQTRLAVLSQNEDGSAAQIVTSSSIITERKQAEARLRQQTRRLQALAELSQLLAEVSQDYPRLLDTIVRHISEVIGDGCSISLVSANREWLELAAISGPDPKIVEAYLQLRKSRPLRVNEGTAGMVFKTGMPVLQPELSIEQVLVAVKPEYRDDAQKFPIYSRVTVPLKAQGRIIGVLTLSRYRPGMPYTLEDQAFLQDLADRAALAIANARLYATLAKELIDRTQIQAERENLIGELEAKNAELERFTYTVSHDLKSPLITIRGFLGYLEKDALSGNIERLRKDIERISDATAKMQRLLNELLELSRIGRLANPSEELAFESVVREALTLTQGQLSARGVEVEVAEDLPRIYGDRVRLVEVVQNLIDNAIKFMGSQTAPCIKIGWKKEPGDKNQNMTLFVQDNGIGIEPQFQEKVFGLFDKLDPRSDGTGVGLALVKRIVEIHGGQIWVESAGPGSGATFYFTLPQAPALVK